MRTRGNPDQRFILTLRELQALEGLGPLAWGVYVLLRSWMDFETGYVGRKNGFALNDLATEMETVTPKGKGFTREKPSEQNMKTALGRLEKAGLIKRIPAQFVVFLLPLAVVGKVRPDQTSSIPNDELSTEHNARKASNSKGFSIEPNTCFHGEVRPYLTHISEQRCTPSQSSSTDSTGVDAAGDDAAAGVNRDRPAPSQAGSLGRPGNTHTDPCRDRPAASHPAQPRRSGSRAQPAGTLPDALRHDTPAGLAENGSAPHDAQSLAEAAEADLRAVLARRAIRVPVGSAQLHAWVDAGVSPVEVEAAADKALEQRARDGSVQPVPLGYVAKVVLSMRSAARRAAVKAGQGAATDGDVEALARTLGLWPAPLGMSMAAFRAKVLAAREAGRGAA